ncbi:hypothetical protein CP532_2601 [Ophiocordyceps camponoti-leonardi (nom. inval.)]|nr:hypothetical protein CP532_2601 [Ophiocordyceps camponoti-leonardi (nom. inval.)]
MPAVKHPCLQCKGDEERPRCRRCEQRHLPCSRPVRKTVFKHDSVASFAKDQKWVNSQAKHFRFHPRGAATARELTPIDAIIGIPRRHSPLPPLAPPPPQQQPPPPPPAAATPQPPPPPPPSSSHDQPSNPSPAVQSIAYITSPPDHYERSKPESTSPAASPPTSYPSCQPHQSPPSENVVDNGLPSSRFPLRDVQEACLLRYFIEEMSHWFDLCDPHRHFQLVVPIRAGKHPHLLHAIFAVAARHLSRLPQYKTPQGILYHDQLLPNLNEHAAVEYMLKCIPALRQFHDMHDDDYRDSIITTAVILRQLEEIDHEDESSAGPARKQVNFLAIIDAVLRSLPSLDVFAQRSLMQAAYWMALRQEIFNSFTRHEAPQLILPLEFWHSASKANKVVMHLVQTAKWHWGDGSESEWQRLSKQQELIEQKVLVAFRPTYQRTADKTKGEIFPTIWYASNIDVTSVQLALIAKAVLVAENPYLKSPPTSRANWRLVENEVRNLLLDLCGIALCNPASPPALVQAALGIGMYGDFFTDFYQRQAIRIVVERYRDAHAWPVQRLLDKFR